MLWFLSFNIQLQRIKSIVNTIFQGASFQQIISLSSMFFFPYLAETYFIMGLVGAWKGIGIDLRHSIEAYQGVQIAT